MRLLYAYIFFYIDRNYLLCVYKNYFHVSIVFYCLEDKYSYRYTNLQYINYVESTPKLM